MNALKGYLVPKKQKKNDVREKVAVTLPIEMTVTPPGGSGISTPMRRPPSTRSSLFPAGDFRNNSRVSILDIKADVMISWLHTQQLQNLWSSGLPGEGVILKKARDSFTCSPATLRNEVNGLFDNVMALNVRVSLQIFCSGFVRILLIFVRTVRYDCSDTSYEDLLSKAECYLCSFRKWAPTSSIALGGLLAQMSKTSLWRVLTRPTNARRLG
jgi:hypothetical protein